MQLHSQRRNVYEVCQRCGVTWPLSKMDWQNGILVCHPNRCYDKGKMPIVGSRELAVARQVAIWRHELEPDPKITSPIERRQDAVDVMY